MITSSYGFNEAAGFTQRKQEDANRAPRELVMVTASMRPPVLPSGNNQRCRLEHWAAS